MERLKGFIAAPFTAFHENGDLDLSKIEAQAEHLTKNRINGVLVCGTTGEAGSLTITERMAVAKRWCEIASSSFPVLVHVGHSSLREGRALAEHAVQCGAQGIAALAPYYFRPANADLVIESCALLAGGAPSLPFYYYHLPSITGVTIPVFEILKRLNNRIPNFAGVKFTYEDLHDFGLSLEFMDRKYDLLFGRDEALLAGLELGAEGAIGSTYNYIGPVFHNLLRSFRTCDLQAAQRYQEKARKIIEIMSRAGGLSAGKALMKMAGVDCGPVRLPLAPLRAKQVAELEAAVAAEGFFDVCRLADETAEPAVR